MRFLLAFFSLFLVAFHVQANTDSTALDSSKKQVKVVQISGLTLGSDSLKPVSFCNVMVKSNYRGTLADFSGFFTIVAKAGDTLLFNASGYKLSTYVIPDTLEEKQYSLIQLLDLDTINIKEVVVTVWPTYDQFKKAFLNTKVPENPQMALARKNLDKQLMEEQAINLGLGAGGNQKLMLQNHTSALYSAGQVPTTNWLNPIAWAKFIEAWRSGEFKKKKDK